MDSTTLPPAAPARIRPVLALSSGWGTFRARLGPHLLAVVVLFALLVVGAFVPILNLVIAFVVAPALYAGGARYLLRATRGESPDLATIFDGFRRWASVTGAWLVVVLVSMAIATPLIVVTMVTIGLQFLLHPERVASAPAIAPTALLPIFVAAAICYPALFWWAARTWPVLFVVMEPEAPSAMQAVRRAWAMTRGNVWRTIGLFALALPLEIAGLIALCVGIVPAIATWYFGLAHAYEMLRRVPERTHVDAVTEPERPIL